MTSIHRTSFYTHQKQNTNAYSRLQELLSSSSSPNSSLSSLTKTVCSRIKSNLDCELIPTKESSSDSFRLECTSNDGQEELEKGTTQEQTEQDKEEPKSSIRRNVSFNNIEIRRYNVTLGKHLNEYDLGPSVTLDWSYHENEEERRTVDDYENERLTSRRSTEDLCALSRLEREELLQAQGFNKNLLDRVTQSSAVRKSWKNSLDEF